MGLSYFSVTTRGAARDALIAYLASGKRQCVIAPTEGEVTTFFDAEINGGLIYKRFNHPWLYRRGATDWEPIIADLSRQLACVAWAVEVYDNDILYYELYEAGALADEYCSDVMYFGQRFYEQFLLTEGATQIFDPRHAEILCQAFAAEATLENVDQILKWDPRACQAQERHTALVQALGLPEYARYQGYLRWDNSWIETCP